MPTRDTSVRLGVTGDERFKRDLRAAGVEGDRALDRITKGARPASTGLQAVNNASKEARRGLEGMAASSGPVGRALSGINTGGLLAAAGIGALALGLNKAKNIALDAVSDFDQLGKTADKIGIATDSLQELRFAAGSLAGFTDQQLDTSLQRLSRKMGDAARGVGEAVKVFGELDVEIQNSDGTLRALDDVLGDVAVRMDAMTSDQQRLSTAVKLFDSEGAGMVNVLRDAGQAMEDTRARARDLGIVIDEQVIRNAEEMQDRLDTASKVIDANLKQAFIDLAPIVLEVVELFASSARVLNDVRDAIVDVENASQRGLESQATTLQGLIGDLEAGLRAYDDAVAAGTNTLRQDASALAAEPLLRARIAELEEIEAELARREAARARPSPTISAGPTASGSGGTPADLSAAIAAVDRQADADLKRLRTQEDLNIAKRAEIVLQNEGIEAADRFLAAERRRLAEERAGQDARTAALRSGLTGDDATQAALDGTATVRLDENRRAAEKSFNDARKAQEQRIADSRKADEAAKAAELKLEQDFQRERERLERAAMAAREREADEQRRLDEQRIADKQAALDRLAGLERDIGFERALSIPVISGAGRVGEANTLEELEALREKIRAETRRADIQVAGDRAASLATEFEDPERLRAFAEERVRLTQEEVAANDVIREREDLLRAEADARLKSIEAASAAAQEQFEAQERANAQIVAASESLFQQAQQWDSVGEAILGVAGELQKLGAFESLFDGFFGNTDGGGSNPISSLFGGAGAGLGDLFGGGGLARSLPAIPFNFEGGGRTPNVPRVGGLDGRGGFLAMVHGNERIIDETLPGNQSGGVVNISMPINIPRGASREDARAFERSGDQISRRVAQEVGRAQRRQ